MKRLFAIILIVFLSASMLSGCLFPLKPPGKEEKSGTSSSQESVYAELAGKYVLIHWSDEEGDLLEYLVSEGIRGSEMYIELREDGSYTWDMSAVGEWVDRGTYELVDDKNIIFTYKDGEDRLIIEKNIYLHYQEDDNYLVFEKIGSAASAPVPLPAQAFNFTEVLDAATPVYRDQLIGYFDLNKEERLLYEQLTEGLANFDMRIGVDFNIRNDADVETLLKVGSVIHCSFPDIFWHKSFKFYPNGNKGSDGKYSILPIYYVDGKHLNAEFSGPDQIVYPTDKEINAAESWIKKGKSAIREKLNEIPVHTGMSPFEVEVAVYDWLRDNVVYENSYDNDVLFQFKNIYGTIVNGRGDCMGYSKSFQYIMSQLGFETLMIGGLLQSGSDITESGGRHGWNAIKLDGEWYHLDLTNDSFYYHFDGRGVPYHYFLNLTDKFLKENDYVRGEGGANQHEIKVNISCTSTKYNYYEMTDAYIASEEDFLSKVPARIIRAVENGERGFDMLFDPAYAAVVDINAVIRKADPIEGVDIKTYFGGVKNMFFCVLE